MVDGLYLSRGWTYVRSDRKRDWEAGLKFRRLDLVTLAFWYLWWRVGVNYEVALHKFEKKDNILL
jgi:hypothetical protein